MEQGDYTIIQALVNSAVHDKTDNAILALKAEFKDEWKRYVRVGQLAAFCGGVLMSVAALVLGGWIYVALHAIEDRIRAEADKQWPEMARNALTEKFNKDPQLHDFLKNAAGAVKAEDVFQVAARDLEAKFIRKDTPYALKLLGNNPFILGMPDPRGYSAGVKPQLNDISSAESRWLLVDVK